MHGGGGKREGGKKQETFEALPQLEENLFSSGFLVKLSPSQPKGMVVLVALRSC